MPRNATTRDALDATLASIMMNAAIPGAQILADAIDDHIKARIRDAVGADMNSKIRGERDRYFDVELQWDRTDGKVT